MKRPEWRLTQDYNELPAYSFVNPVHHSYMPKEWLDKNDIISGYLICWTARGYMQIPAEMLEDANKY